MIPGNDLEAFSQVFSLETCRLVSSQHPPRTFPSARCPIGFLCDPSASPLQLLCVVPNGILSEKWVKGGELGGLDFRMGGIGAPINGLKAFATTGQLGIFDKLANALALGTSPIVKALFNFDWAMVSKEKKASCEVERALDDLCASVCCCLLNYLYVFRVFGSWLPFLPGFWICGIHFYAHGMLYSVLFVPIVFGLLCFPYDVFCTHRIAWCGTTSCVCRTTSPLVLRQHYLLFCCDMHNVLIGSRCPYYRSHTPRALHRNHCFRLPLSRKNSTFCPVCVRPPVPSEAAIPLNLAWETRPSVIYFRM